ncbi:MAG: FkbM family methyltransferase [Planctomycetota bacterium]
MSMNVRKLVGRYAAGPVDGVVHVGAHHGQEAATYDALGIERRVWVEPDPDSAAVLRERVAAWGGGVVIEAGAGETPATLELHRYSGKAGAVEGVSNSLLSLGDDAGRSWSLEETETVAVRVDRLDTLLDEAGSPMAGRWLLVVDTQGYERACLAGAERTLASSELVVCEVSEKPFYEGGAQIGDVDEIMVRHGFGRVYTRWAIEGHGDALYARVERLPLTLRAVHALRGGRVKHADGRSGWSR